MHEVHQEEAAVKKVAEDVITPFTQEELVQSWMQFADYLEKHESLKNLITSHAPELKEDYVFEVTLYNPVQRDELLEVKIKLLEWLQKRLKNTKIDMKVTLTNKEDHTLLVTNEEKLKYLAKVNPLLIDLTEEFNLKLD